MGRIGPALGVTAGTWRTKHPFALVRLTSFVQSSFVIGEQRADRGHLVGCEVDLIDLCEDLEGGPGQAGEQVCGKQQDLETDRKHGSVQSSL